MKIFKVAMAAGVALLLSLSAQASLVATAGGKGVYDTVNNVTWTSDANLMLTQANSYSGGASAYVAAVIAASGGVIHDSPNINDTPQNSGTYTLSANDFLTSDIYAGRMTWFGAKAWVNYLNYTNYAGTNTWRLPFTVDPGAAYQPFQHVFAESEELFNQLGKVSGCNLTTCHNSNFDIFSNLKDAAFWSLTEYSLNADYAWGFYTVSSHGYGSFPSNKWGVVNSFAVSPGQIGALSAVPVPGAVWLLGSGVMGLVGLRRRKATAQSGA